MLFAGLGGDSEDGDTKEKDEEAERERLEAIKEAEERRKEKHRKMEEEREKMRQDIRDKVRSFGIETCCSMKSVCSKTVFYFNNRQFLNFACRLVYVSQVF